MPEAQPDRGRPHMDINVSPQLDIGSAVAVQNLARATAAALLGPIADKILIDMWGCDLVASFIYHVATE